MATRIKEYRAFSVWQALLYSLIPNFEEEVDPGNPVHQIAVQSAILQLADLVGDKAAREGIQSIAKKSIAANAQKLAK